MYYDNGDGSGYDDNSSTAQTLVNVLAGGLGAYVDSQNHQPVTVTTPAPQTAYGYAGYGQYTPAAAASSSGVAGLSPTVLLVAAVAIGLLIVLKKKA